MKLMLAKRPHAILSSVLSAMRPLPHGGSDFDRALRRHLKTGAITPEAAQDLSTIVSAFPDAKVPNIDGKLEIMERYAASIEDVLAVEFKGAEEKDFEIDNDLGRRVGEELRRVVDSGEIAGQNLGPMLRLLKEVSQPVLKVVEEPDKKEARRRKAVS